MAFQKKTQQLDWSLFLSLNVDALQQGGEAAEEEIENLYIYLVEANIEKDPNATVENLKQLFRVIQLVMELKGVYLEDAIGEIKTLENQIQEQDEEISALKKEINKSSGDKIKYKENLAKVDKALEETQQKLQKEREHNQSLTIENTLEKEKNSGLQENLENVKKELNNYKKRFILQVAKEKTIKTDEQNYRNSIREQNYQIEGYLDNIKNLQNENNNLHTEIENMTTELEAMMAELDENQASQKEAQNRLDENEQLINELISEKEALKQKIEIMSEQMEFTGNQKDTICAKYKSELESVQSSADSLNASLLDKDTLIKKLQDENNQLKYEIEIHNTDALHRKLAEKDLIISNMSHKLEESYKDFELLSLEWDKIDKSLLESKKDRISQKKIKPFLEKFKEEKDRLTEERIHNNKKMKQLEQAINQKNEECIRLKTRVLEYEKGVYGLEEASNEIKELEKKVKLRDKNIIEQTEKINKLEKELDTFFEENDILRREMGLPEGKVINPSSSLMKKNLELEKLRSMNAALQDEIDKMEEERLSLKAQLRLNAVERGERAHKLGMSTDDLIAVEDFSMKLNEKNKNKSKLEKELKKAEEKIKDIDFENKKLKIEIRGNEKDIHNLKDKLDQAEKEKEILKSAAKELSNTFLHGKTINNNDYMDSVQKLIKLLESQSKKDVNNNIKSVGLYEEFTSINIELKRQLDDITEKYSELSKEKESFDKQIENLLIEVEKWKVKALAPRKRTIEIPENLRFGDITDISSIVEQLIECIQDCEIKTNEVNSLKEEVSKHKDIVFKLISQQRFLYLDYNKQKKEYEEKLEKLKSELDEMLCKNDIQSNHIKELESLSSRSDNELHKKVVDLSRNNMMLKITESNTNRKCDAIMEREKNLRKEMGEIKNNNLEIEKYTINALIYYKDYINDANSKIDYLSNKLLESVPKKDNDILQSKFEKLTNSYKNLLLWRDDWLKNKKNMQINLQQEKEVNKKLSSDLYQAIEEKEKAKLVANGVNELPQEALLLTQIEAYKNKIQVLEDKIIRMETSDTKLNEDLQGLQEKFMNSIESAIKLDEMNKISEEDKKEELSKEEKINNLTLEVNKLKGEVQKYKELSDLSYEQAKNLELRQSSNEKEKDILRAALEEFQIENDEKLLIGKLHEHIIALQLKEDSLKKEMESLKTKCINLENKVVVSNKNIQEKDNSIYQLKVEFHMRIRKLQRNIEQLRTNLSGFTKLNEFEKLSKEYAKAMINDIIKIEKITEYEEEIKELKDKLSEAELTTELKDELLTILKQPGKISDRILTWHKKISTLELNYLKIKRQLNDAKESEIQKENEITKRKQDIEDLEELIVKQKNEFEEEALNWEAREFELEKMVATLEEERDRVISISDDINNDLPDKSLPLWKQLERSIEVIKNKNKQLLMNSNNISNLKAQLKDSASCLELLKKQMSSKEKSIVDLSDHILKQKNLSDDKENNGNFANKLDFEVECRKREEKAFKMAKETIKTFQQQLKRKEETIIKYQNMLKETRKEILKQKEDSKKEILKLNEEINALHDQNITKLKTPKENTNYTEYIRSIDEESEQKIRDLEDMINDRDNEIKDTKQQIIDMQQKQSADIEQLNNRIEEISYCVKEKDDVIEEKNNIIKDLEVSLNEAIELSKKNLPEEIEKKISGLRKEIEDRNSIIDQKEKKEKSLIAAINDLKKEFIETDKIKTLNNDLQFKLKNTEEILQKSQKKNIKLKNDLEDLIKNIENIEKIKKEQETQISIYKDKLSDLRIKNKKMETDIKINKELLNKQSEKIKNKSIRPTSANSVKSVSSDSSISLRPSSADDAYQKWNNTKKLTKQIDILKKKLAEKTSECETQQITIKRLKDMNSRLEHSGFKRRSNSNSNGTTTNNNENDTFITTLNENDYTKRYVELLNSEEKLQKQINDLKGQNIYLEAENEKLQCVDMVEKEKQVETYKQKIIQLEEKLSIMNRYVEEFKRKENSKSIFDDIPDTQQFNKLKDEIKKLEDKNEELNRKLGEKEIECIELVQVIKGNNMVIEKQTKKMNDIELEKDELQKQLNDTLNMSDTNTLTLNSLIKTMEKDKYLSKIVPVFHHLTNTNYKLKSEVERLSSNSLTLRKYTQYVQNNLLQHRKKNYENLNTPQKSKNDNENEIKKSNNKKTIESPKNLNNESKNTKLLIEKLKKENNQLLASQDAKNKEIKLLREQLCKFESDEEDSNSSKIDSQEVMKLKSELKTKDDILNTVINTTDINISTSYNQKLQSIKYNKQVESLNKKLKDLTEEKDALMKEKVKLEAIIAEKERKNQQSQYHFQLIMEENEKLKAEIFSNQFYEELEDLKENYKEALEQNQHYIKVIERLKSKIQST
ncbi:hypothetical protein BCR36DRAFT_586919 [Piromyces finnis]|uniref:Uncharacterized protein n=1 Tax=Piromyces finnis TaxID=1754191 RepID=A0A1Y1UYR7_9FUNG|nr:hypothetical protein BCR36DRAFT_586919 [Piromyces finnis]|eukprot:ORX42993.1 hypothetical protein BCR36DRAFT_586919 [Piromyces finnis]